MVEVRDSFVLRVRIDWTRARSVWTFRPLCLYDGLHEASSTSLVDCERRAGPMARQPKETET